MGLFSTIFGSVAGSQYSDHEQTFSEGEIKKLVSAANVISLSKNDETEVEQAIMARRRGDGKISLRQIYQVLTKLKDNYKISHEDKASLMKVFGEYFKNK